MTNPSREIEQHPELPRQAVRVALALNGLPDKQKGRATYAGLAKRLNLSESQTRQIVRIAKRYELVTVQSSGNGAGRGIKSVIYLSEKAVKLLQWSNNV